jgi:hypothetical protein
VSSEALAKEDLLRRLSEASPLRRGVAEDLEGATAVKPWGSTGCFRFLGEVNPRLQVAKSLAQGSRRLTDSAVYLLGLTDHPCNNADRFRLRT